MRILLSFLLSLCLVFEQTAFAQAIDLSHYFVHNPSQNISQSNKFRPAHLRYISYDRQANDFRVLLDKGDAGSSTPKLDEVTRELMKYFFIGLALPNDKFWVNLRPDYPDNILDPDLEQTDIGRIFLEADLQLKKDTSSFTSPQTPEGKAYWDKLYKKAEELFGTENITIPTVTRPWIVPNEIVIREAPDNAYIYKATLKVMLEEDYLDNQKTEKPKNIKTKAYTFQDPRLKELNQYSTRLIKEAIIPKLTYEVNTSKRYAQLRQVYYSLILAQWFKQKYGSLRSIRAPVNNYINLIDSGNLVNLISSQSYDKQAYFQQYRKSFKDGEYNLQEPVYTPMGQGIRRYMSGGIGQFNNILGCASPMFGKGEVSSAISGTNFFQSYVVSYSSVVKGIKVFPRVSIYWFRGVIKSLLFKRHKKIAKQRNIDLNLRDIPANMFKGIIDGVYWFPSELAEQMKNLMRLNNNRNLDAMGSAWDGSIEINSDNIIGSDVLERTVWHELIHQFSLLNTRNGKPLIPIRTWKMIAREAGFYGAFINDKLIPLESLPEDHKVWRKLSYGSWVYKEYDNQLYCYVRQKDYKECSEMFRYFDNGIMLKIYKDDEYWKTTPYESVAEAGQEYMFDSNCNRYNNRRFEALVRLASNVLFIIQKTDGSLWKYEFYKRNNQKFIRSLTKEERREWKKLQGIPREERNGNVSKGVYLKAYFPVKVKYEGPIEVILAPDSPSPVNLAVCGYYDLPLRYKDVIGPDGESGSYFVVRRDSGSIEYLELPHRIIKNIGLEYRRFVQKSDVFADDVHLAMGFDYNEKALYVADKNSRFGTKVIMKSFNSDGDKVNKNINGENINKPVSSDVVSQEAGKGGIAFNSLPIQTESITSSALGALSGVRAFKGDLDAEWTQIQAVFNAGIRPSAQRLADFAAAACCASPLDSQRKEDILKLIAELLRRDEEGKGLVLIEPMLRNLLGALESGLES